MNFYFKKQENRLKYPYALKNKCFIVYAYPKFVITFVAKTGSWKTVQTLRQITS